MIDRHFDQLHDRASYERRRLRRQPGIGHSLASPGAECRVRRVVVMVLMATR